MISRSVGNRIGVDFDSFGISLSREDMLAILARRSISPIAIDIDAVARDLVGKAQWKLPSLQSEAPHFFTCASLTKWLYGQRGIWIPRRLMHQLAFCQEYGSIHALDEIVGGDLIFLSSPYRNGVKTDTGERVGHVCIATNDGEAICATNSEFGTGIVKLPIHSFLSSRELAAVGRVVRKGANITTLVFPPETEIETVDDIRSIIIRSLR